MAASSSRPSFAGRSDADLLAALRTGDRHAYREAMSRYGGAMLAAARGIAPSHAEDAVQEAWVSCLGALEKFEGRASLKTWLVRITMNKAYNHLRRSGREISLDGLEAGQDPLANAFSDDGRWHTTYQRWDDDTPDALLEAHVLKECLDRHLDGLPSGQRMAITLNDIEGLSPTEICNTLAISPTNFRVLLHRARIRIFGMVSHYEETGEC